MGNIGMDISVEELCQQHQEAIKIIAEQATARRKAEQALKQLRKDLKAANQRHYKISQTAGKQRKALEEIAEMSTDVPNEVDWYRTIVWEMIGIAAQAIKRVKPKEES